MTKSLSYFVLVSFLSIHVYSMQRQNRRSMELPSQQPSFFAELSKRIAQLIHEKNNLSERHEIGGYFDFPLVRVSSYENVRCIQLAEELLNAGADPNAGNPLHHAAQANAVTIVDKLLNAGANINSFCGLGQTALHVAIDHDSYEAAQLLLVQGANTSLQERQHSETPLMYAIKKMKQSRDQHDERKFQQWRSLVCGINENQISIGAKNDQEKTALDLAEGLDELAPMHDMKIAD